MARYIRTNQRIGKNLRAVRTNRGMTQQELADCLTRHRPAITEIEAGRRSLTLAEAWILSKCLGCTLYQLVDHAPDTLSRGSSLTSPAL